MKKTKRRGTFLLALGALLLGLGILKLYLAPDLLQYLLAAPQVTPAQGEQSAHYQALGDQADALEKAMADLSGNLSSWTVAGESYDAGLVGDTGGSAQARLVAAGKRYFEVYPKYLLAGRLPSPEELTYGERVIVLDEDLALKLFQVSEPLNRLVTWGENQYRVIGIARHSRSVGESALYSAYIPLRQVVKDAVQLDALTASAAPIPRTGAPSAFEQAVTEVQAGGDFYEVDKEALRGRMLPRLCLVCLLACALVYLLKRALAFGVQRAGAFRARLRLEYARDMLPWLAGGIALSLLGAAAALGAIYLLAQYAVEPVYRFPEWVPPVLVEWEDIQSTFWNLAGAAAKPIRRVSQEVSQVRFWSTIARWGLVSLGLGLTLRGLRIKAQRNR